MTTSLNFKAKLNGREIALTAHNVAQTNIAELFEELTAGFEQSPYRQKINGAHEYRKKVEVKGYKLEGDTILIEAVGKNCTTIKEWIVCVPDRVFNTVSWK